LQAKLLSSTLHKNYLLEMQEILFATATSLFIILASKLLITSLITSLIKAFNTIIQAIKTFIQIAIALFLSFSLIAASLLLAIIIL